MANRLLDLYGLGDQPSYSGDGDVYTTASLMPGIEREQAWRDSAFGRFANYLDSVRRPATRRGDGVTVFGKGLEALGLDASGARAATPMNEAVANTFEAFHPDSLINEGLGTMNRWAGAAAGYGDQLQTQDVLAPLGLSAMAAPFMPKNAVGIFGGKLAKTADHQKLAQAEQMQAQGVPREQIWNDTGWFQGVDGKWRFEIDDSGSRMADFYSDAKFPAVRKAHVPKESGQYLPQALPLEDYIKHPELERAYWPTREQAPSVIFDDLVSARGKYSPAIDTVTMDSGSFLAKDEGRSTALHELQHAIQSREGMARGGSIDDFIYQNSPLFKERKSYETPSDSYRRISGEVEARTVQKRMDLTPEQRAARPPWLDYDVPESDQIVRLLSDQSRSSLPGTVVNALEDRGSEEELLKLLRMYGVQP